MTKENRGALFNNGYKEDGDKRPDLVGELNVEGRGYRIAAWKNQSKKGLSYLSLSIEESEDVETESSGEDESSKVPF